MFKPHRFLVERVGIGPVRELNVECSQIAGPDGGVRAAQFARNAEGALEIRYGGPKLTLEHVIVPGFTQGVLEIKLDAASLVLSGGAQMNLHSAVIFAQVGITDRQIGLGN